MIFPLHHEELSAVFHFRELGEILRIQVPVGNAPRGERDLVLHPVFLRHPEIPFDLTPVDPVPRVQLSQPERGLMAPAAQPPEEGELFFMMHGQTDHAAERFDPVFDLDRAVDDRIIQFVGSQQFPAGSQFGGQLEPSIPLRRKGKFERLRPIDLADGPENFPALPVGCAQDHFPGKAAVFHHIDLSLDPFPEEESVPGVRLRVHIHADAGGRGVAEFRGAAAFFELDGIKPDFSGGGILELEIEGVTASSLFRVLRLPSESVAFPLFAQRNGRTRAAFPVWDGGNHHADPDRIIFPVGLGVKRKGIGGILLQNGTWPDRSQRGDPVHRGIILGLFSGFEIVFQPDAVFAVPGFFVIPENRNDGLVEPAAGKEPPAGFRADIPEIQIPVGIENKNRQG